MNASASKKVSTDHNETVEATKIKEIGAVQELGIVKGDELQKISSAGFIIGAILIVIGSIWPVLADISSLQESQQKKFGEQPALLQADALLITFGYWAVMMGTAGVYRSITARGAAWARLGFYFLVMGTALWTVGYSLDVSYPAALVNWQAAAAADKESAYSVITAIRGFGRGLFPMEVIAYWLALALLGIGMVRSAVYRRWLGWVGLMLGIAGVLLGISQTFTGRESSFLLFVLLMSLTTLWFLTIGIWVARKAWQKGANLERNNKLESTA
jgi:hypothetical protein